MRAIITLILIFAFNAASAQGFMQQSQALARPDHGSQAFLYIKKEFGHTAAGADNHFKLGFKVNRGESYYDPAWHLSPRLLEYHGVDIVSIEYSMGTRRLSRFQIGALGRPDFPYILKQNGEDDGKTLGLTKWQWLAVGLVGVVAVVVAVASDDCGNAPTYQVEFCPAD